MSMDKKFGFISPENQDMIYKKIREEKEKTLENLIKENPYNKEPFDYQKFVELYWRQDIQGNDLNGSESKLTIEEYTRLYYGSFPEAKTIEDFAKAKEKLDSEIN